MNMVKKKKRSKGFTLLEILVAVLIIGILAAIAVPSYQKAVEKGKTADPITNLSAIAKAQKAKKLTSLHYTDKIEELDLTFVDNEEKRKASGKTFNGKDFFYTVYGDDEAVAVAKRKNIAEDKEYELSVDYATGELFCRPEGHPICLELGLGVGRVHGRPVYDTQNIQNWKMKDWVEYIRDEIADLWVDGCFDSDITCIQDKAFSLCSNNGDGVCLNAKRSKQITGADGFTYYWDNNAAYPVLRINDYASRPFFAEIFFTPGGGVYLRGNYGHNGTVIDDLCAELGLRSHTPEFSPGWATCSLKN